MTSSLFFINVKTESKICLSFGEWICTESLTQNFLQDIKNNEYRVAFISQENIFSHSMNVFRKTLFQKDTIAVIGIKEILYTLQNACSCIIDIINASIFIGETASFRKNIKFKNLKFDTKTPFLVSFYSQNCEYGVTREIEGGEISSIPVNDNYGQLIIDEKDPYFKYDNYSFTIDNDYLICGTWKKKATFLAYCALLCKER